MQRMARRHFLLAAGAAAALASTKAGLAQAAKLAPKASDVLIVVDIQNCFTAGGSLAVPKAEEIIPLVNRIAKGFQNVVLTQDWHTPGHISFASTHANRKPFDTIDLPYGKQVLWPDHCVQGTPGADIHKDISIPHAQLVIRKGYRKGVDSYSAFFEADRKTSTGLGGYLKQRGINRVFCVGLATDFCVAWTAMDARREGFAAYVIEDAARGIDAQGSLAAAWKAMAAQGVKKIQAADLAV
ncbi:MAG: bifunctional nicotinamidase/pyrazinamidase [Alphaproteobacteria bacterium]